MKTIKGFLYAFSIVLVSLPLFAQNNGIQWDNYSIHGFVSQGFLKSSANNFLARTSEGTLQFNELGLNFSIEPYSDLRFGAQVLSRDLGSVGNNSPFIDWALVDYSWKDYLGVRAGKIKMPLGFYNEYRDLDMARTTIFLPQGSYIESWRESFTAITGVGLYGIINAGFANLGEFNYQLQAGMIKVDDETGLSRTIEDELLADLTSYDVKPGYVASITWDTPLDGLKLGASRWMTEEIKGKGRTSDVSFWRNQTIGVATGIANSLSLPAPTNYEEAQQIAALTGLNLDLVNAPMVQKIGDIDAMWLSAEYTWEDLIFAYETFELGSRLTTMSPGFGTDFGQPELETLRDFKNTLGGYYGSIGYRINEQWATSAYHSEYYLDKNDVNTPDGRLIDTALSLRFDLSNHWTFKVEGHRMDGTAVMYNDDQDKPGDLAKNWYLFASKVTFNF